MDAKVIPLSRDQRRTVHRWVYTRSSQADPWLMAKKVIVHYTGAKNFKAVMYDRYVIAMRCTDEDPMGGSALFYMKVPPQICAGWLALVVACFTTPDMFLRAASEMVKRIPGVLAACAGREDAVVAIVKELGEGWAVVAVPKHFSEEVERAGMYKSEAQEDIQELLEGVRSCSENPGQLWE